MFGLMMVFYLLSILVMVFGGLYLASDMLVKKVSFVNDVVGIVEKNSHGKLILIIVSLVVSFLKFIFTVGSLSPEKVYRSVPVVGDLLPAIACALIGVILIFDLIWDKDKDTTTVESEDGVEAEVTEVEEKSKFKKFVTAYKNIFGIAILVVALIHFFVPWALFL